MRTSEFKGPRASAAFKKANRHIDFTWVDRMEKMTVPVAKSTAFLRAGLVKPREGGSK